MVPPLLPAPDPRTSVVLLLRPEQAAWLRNHAGRGGVSAFMRRLLDEQIEGEQREIERARRRLRRRQAEELAGAVRPATSECSCAAHGSTGEPTDPAAAADATSGAEQAEPAAG